MFNDEDVKKPAKEQEEAAANKKTDDDVLNAEAADNGEEVLEPLAEEPDLSAQAKDEEDRVKHKKDKKKGKDEVEDLKEELAKALASAEDYRRKWYSVSAEYDNYRKRNANAVSQAYADGKAEAVKKLLPVADNFGYAYDGASDEKTKAGIDKIIKSFRTILSSFGIEELDVEIGATFDESVAEAILTVPVAEGEQPNTIKQVLKKGYKQGEKVIRFAQVSVTV